MGAAAANRNEPPVSGATGAAAGAAAVNRNSPQYSGAQGAALGAAAATNQQPQYSAAQGAALAQQPSTIINRNIPVPRVLRWVLLWRIIIKHKIPPQ